jgi:hypothetical protein
MTDTTTKMVTTMTDNESEKISFINNFWGTRIIPAIVTHTEKTCLAGRYDVWIPEGYEGSGGYSTRKPSDITEFTGTEEMRQDVMKQWATEKQKCGK